MLECRPLDGITVSGLPSSATWGGISSDAMLGCGQLLLVPNLSWKDVTPENGRG